MAEHEGPAARAASPTRRLDSLDGLRGHAALCVLVFHSLLALDQMLLIRMAERAGAEGFDPRGALETFVLTTFNGRSAVLLFFILSGSVLFPVALRDLRWGTARGTAAFCLRRVLRIYPAHMLALLGMLVLLRLQGWVVPGWGYAFTDAQILRNLLLIAPEVSGPTWTLTAELIATPFVIAAALALARTGLSALPLLAGLLVLPILLGLLGVIYAHYLYYFLVGCLVPTRFGAAVCAGLRRIGGTVGGILLLLAFVYLPLFGNHLAVVVPQGLAGGALIALLYHDPTCTLGRLLQNRVSVLLGRASYGLYLWHYPILFPVFAFFTIVLQPRGYDPLVIGLVFAVPTALVAIALGLLSDRFVERPFIRLGHRASDAIVRARRFRPVSVSP